MKLSEKQKKFADHYITTGNASESARRAGYSDTYAKTHVYKLLENASLVGYIEKQTKKIQSKRVATMQEVHEFWTTVMREDDAEMKDRVKVSEYIAKANGAFLDKVEHSGGVSMSNPYANLTEDELRAIARRK